MVGLYFKRDQNTKMHRIRLMWLCVWLGCLMSLSAMTISDLPTFPSFQAAEESSAAAKPEVGPPAGRFHLARIR